MIDFSGQTYLSTTKNRATKLSKAYPTVQFYIVFSRYVELDGGVMGPSITDRGCRNIFGLTGEKTLINL